MKKATTKRRKFTQKQNNAIGALELAGLKMSNFCFNVSQREPCTVDDRERAGMKQMQVEWDAAHREFKAALKALL